MTMDLAYSLKGYPLTNTQRVIYGVLCGLSRASAAKGLPYTYIGQRAIAERVGVCERTANAAIKQLREVGLILVKRRGQGLNNQIYVLFPNATREERQNKKACIISRPAKNADAYYITPQKANKQDSKTIYPVVSFDNAASPQIKNSGFTPSKGKPTPKRPRKNVEERQRIKKKYKEYLYQRLKVDDLHTSLLSTGEECESVEKIIELMANTMSSNGKVMVSGSLMTPQQWWYVVKNISQQSILDLIYSIPETINIKSVKNPRAYLLASIYNAAMMETLERPWYSNPY